MKNKRIRLYETLRKPTTAALLLVCLACILLACRFFRFGTSGMGALHMYVRYFYFPSAILTVLAYLSSITSFRSRTDEVLSAQKYPGYYQNRTFLFMLGCSVVLLVSLLVVLLMLSASNDVTDYFLGYFGKSFVYNLVLPLWISLGVAYLTARMGNRIGSAVLLVLFLLLTSPVFTNLVWYTKPAIPVDQLLKAVLHPFRIYYENHNWAACTQLGLQTDWSRGSLLLFWVLFLAAAICFSLLRKKAPKRAVSGVLALASLCCLVYACLPSGAFRIDDSSWDGTMQDYMTYSDQPVGVHYDDIDYAFTDYDLELHFGRNLAVEARLQLHSDTPATQFEFTLYHSYRIRSLTGVDVPVAWSRTGDTVTLCTEKPVTDCTLYLTYRGSHKIFFAFSEGALLPGWFPWYPMAGRHPVILNFETYTSCYNVFNRIQPAHITLRSNGRFTTLTNLEEGEDGSFSGTGDSITLLGGEIMLLPQGQIRDCLPLDLVQDPETWAEEQLQQWKDTCDTLALYGLEPPAGADGDILIAAEEINRFGAGLTGVALFDDYILACNYQLSLDTVSRQMMLRYNSDSYLASLVCSWGGLQDTPQETCSYWLGFLQGGGSANSLEIALREALEAAEAAEKGGDAVGKIAQFLCQEGATGNEQAFLERLRDQYDSN